MMRPCGEDLKIYLHRAPIDMRKGRNALAALAQQVMKVDPYAYLLHLLEQLPVASTAEALEALLPWNVKPVLRRVAV